MINILLWVIFGGIAGWLATLIMGNEGGIGVIGNIVFGIAGAFVGGMISDTINNRSDGSIAERPTSLASFVWAVLGACLILFIINLIW